MARQNDSTHPNRTMFPDGISGPALRALANADVRSMADLPRWSEEELGQLHGMGPKAIAILRDALQASGSGFRTE